ncbi:MAG TPA: MMPL family transporter [Polyangiaceae bacterium]|nr:MMPL family transporter [Polyangiaceae bacterium]
MTGRGVARALLRRLLWIMVPTLLSVLLSATRLHISSDLSTLFPSKGEAAALGRYTRAFGGGDVGLLLLRGQDPGEVAAASHDLADEMRRKPSVTDVLEKAPRPSTDPTLAWLYAGPSARSSLEAALTPSGMRERLAGSRELLLGPSAQQAEDLLSKDPLRLALVPWEQRKAELAAGLTVSDTGEFYADGGRARLLVAQPKGRAFDPKAAHAFVDDFDAARVSVAKRHPNVSMELTGGHAMNVALQALFVRDLAISGTLSAILASLTFLVTFRRPRALVAVLPPLAVGTAWTMGIAALLPNGLSAISVAFAAVVVGVGVDTGVHVYAALLDGRRAGLDPVAAAAFARKKTGRPTMLAAIAAGATFAALGLSELRALRELGLLCGLGEVLTSVAILQLTPEIGALLERRAAAPPLRKTAGWMRALLGATRTRGRAFALLLVALLPVVAVTALGWPTGGNAIVVLRPAGVQPLQTQRAIFDLFGGKPGQWVVLSVDRDETAARDRADSIAEALDPLLASGNVDGYDALASFAPGPALSTRRLAERDRLGLPLLRGRLEDALREAGWDETACAAALDAFSHPSPAPDTKPPAWLASRHIAHDGDDTLAVVYVRPTGDAAKDARALEAIRRADPRAIVTGYARLEVGLKETLARDLPKIGLAALALVAIALGASLRRVSDVAIAATTLAVAVAIVAVAMRVLHIPWHAYDALVVPVLLGITMDEAMFLLYAARGGTNAELGDGAVEGALREQGPLVFATALTTSAGFAALLACRFEGLFDVGAVGAIGSVAGLVGALLVVPAGLRLVRRD